MIPETGVTQGHGVHARAANFLNMDLDMDLS
jgi:hypothetical protein